jgi:hypothetical protein
MFFCSALVSDPGSSGRSASGMVRWIPATFSGAAVPSAEVITDPQSPPAAP